MCSMRPAIALVLTTALVTTPLTLALAQASQQEANSILQPAAQDSSSHRLIRVPPVTDRTARLVVLSPNEDALAAIFTGDGETRPNLGSAATPRAISNGARFVLTALAVIAVTALVLVALLVFAVCGPEGEGCLAS